MSFWHSRVGKHHASTDGTGTCDSGFLCTTLLLRQIRLNSEHCAHKRLEYGFISMTNQYAVLPCRICLQSVS
jgi:hypothetical protein